MPAASLLDAARRWPTWVSASKDPVRAHAEVWKEIATLASAGTYWPERLGSADLPPLERMEPTVYDDYETAILSSYQGTISALTGERVARWILSSGSSGRQKRFPWTPRFIHRMYEAANYPLPMVEGLLRLRGGPGGHLAFHGMTPTKRSPAGIVEGYGSAFDLVEDDIYPDVANASPEAIYWWRPAYAMAADLRSIETVTCEPIFVMLERINADRAFYRSLFSGQTSLPDGYPPLAPTSERRDTLLRVLGSTDELLLTDVWPRLAVVQGWRSGVAGLQARRLEAMHPGLTLVDNHYNCSEGPLSNPLSIDEIGGPIFAMGVVHEFMELGATPSASTLMKPWELEVDRDYEVFLTTAMGFVRYRLRDVVRCTGFFHRAPRIRFRRRLDDEISLGAATFGVDELAHVVGRLSLPPTARTFFAPSPDGRALILHCDCEVPTGTAEALHRALAEGNDTYRSTEAHAWSQHVRVEQLPRDDPAWARAAPTSDQGKRRLLLQEPV